MKTPEETANSLLNNLAPSSEVQERVSSIQNQDPFLELRMTIMNFFTERIGQISRQDNLKLLIERKLEEKLETDELEFGQLMSLYNNVAKQGNQSVDSMLSLFKPTPGVPSILADNIAKNDDESDIFERLYEEFSKEESDKLADLSRLINSLSKQGKETKE